MLASKQQFWCDGLLLECLTKRLRTACVVFSWNKQDKLWQRSVIAHSFQGDVPKQMEEGIPFVAMMLINNHFWLLQPPTLDTPCPSAWLRKTPDKPRHLLKGAGKSTSLSLPSSSAKSVSKKIQSEAQKSKAQLRPRSELSLPASSVDKKRGETLRTALSLPDSRSESSKETGTRTRTCVSSGQEKLRPPVQKSFIKKASSEAKATRSSKEERQREVKHKYWKCPIPKCQFEVNCKLSMLQMTEKRRSIFCGNMDFQVPSLKLLLRVNKFLNDCWPSLLCLLLSLIPALSFNSLFVSLWSLLPLLLLLRELWFGGDVLAGMRL